MNSAGSRPSHPDPAHPDRIRALHDWLEASTPAPLVVETSGSTGRPKRVLLSRRAVEASIDLSARRLGATGRWLLMVPPAFVAGVNVITRALAAGAPPLLLSDHDSFAEATEALGPGGFVSLVPTQLHRLLDSPSETTALTAYHTVLVGGGPVDPSLRARAAAAGVHLVATYGSAETCGGVVYDGLPLDGVGVAIGADGRVRLSGPTLFDGYDGDPELTAEALVDGSFLTSDLGRVNDDGRLELLGRLDDMVITGGLKVPAAVVARRLREHPSVRAAEVLGVADQEWGNRLVAYVVGDVPLEELRDWVAAEHPRAWAPRQVVVLPEMPLLGNGKTDRLALRRRLADPA